MQLLLEKYDEKTNRNVPIGLSWLGSFLLVLTVVAVAIATLGGYVTLQSSKLRKTESKNQSEKYQLSASLTKCQVDSKTLAQENETSKNTYLRSEYFKKAKIQPSTLAFSELFGFKFVEMKSDFYCPAFDQRYTSEGVIVHCLQKPCRDSEVGGVFPNMARSQQSAQCKTELEQRTIPSSLLSSFSVLITPISVEMGQTFESVTAFQPNTATPKGRKYQFTQTESEDRYKTGYARQLNTRFFSPELAGDELSQQAGTFYGSDSIYLQHVVTVDVYEQLESKDELTQEKFTQLMNQLIDSIQFSSR